MERSYPLKPWWDPSTAILWKPPHRSSLGKEQFTESIYKHVGFYIFFLCACYRDKASTFCELYCRKDTMFPLKDFQILAGVTCRVAKAAGGGRNWRGTAPPDMGNLFRVTLEGCTHNLLGCLWASEQLWGYPGWPGLPSPLLVAAGQHQAAEGWKGPNPAHLPGAA